MKKLISLLVLGAIVLSACGSGSPTAATVNGSVITVGDVEELTASGSVIDKVVFSQWLEVAIRLEILSSAAESEYGIAPTDEEVAEEAEEIFSSASVEGQTREEFLDEREISEKLFMIDARWQLIVEAIRLRFESSVQPTQGQIEENTRQAEWSLAEVCAAHILVVKEGEALDVLDRLEAGEDFGELARELSTDTGSGANGGELGCAPPIRYVPEFGEAAMSADLGSPTDPVMSSFGYHVILVSERTDADPNLLPTESEIITQLIPSLVDDELNNWFLGAALGAAVVVEEAYGTWEVGPPPRVAPPA